MRFWMLRAQEMETLTRYAFSGLLHVFLVNFGICSCFLVPYDLQHVCEAHLIRGGLWMAFLEPFKRLLSKVDA